jgi:hypothetical protein
MFYISSVFSEERNFSITFPLRVKVKFVCVSAKRAWRMEAIDPLILNLGSGWM